jgi:hypothetical protein
VKEFFKKNKKITTITLSITTVFSTVFAIYGYYYPSNQNPDIKIIQKNITNVFEIKDDNKDLKIFFKEKDILKENLNLKVVTLKIINDGNSDVSPNNFDTINEPFGLSITNGAIINAEIYKPSIESLINIQNKFKSDSSNFIFKSFIFPIQQSFFVRMTILHSNKKEPSIEVKGRIANTKIQYTNEDNEPMDWKLLGIMISLVFGLYLTIKISSKIYDKLKEALIKKRKRKIIEAYKLNFHGEPKYKEVIKEMYGLIGKTLFNKIKESKYDKGDSLIKKSLEESENQSIYLKAKELSEKTKQFTISVPSGTIIYYELGDSFKKHNCYTEQDGHFSLNDDFYTEIDQIINFFENP